jgi:Arc/MetJ-type ribon-helix-helix transcriptional regulator
MTINLPENLERSILEEVHRGHFVSVDEAIAEAVRLLLRQKTPNAVEKEVTASGEPAASSHPPIWELFEQITASIPEEEWAKLPSDGAEQHDHYIYGTPKRPAT